MTEPLAYGIPEAAAALCINERTIWRRIAAGELRAFKCGARTLIRAEVLRGYLDRLSGEESGPFVHETSALG